MPQRGISKAIEVDVQNVTKPAHAGTGGSSIGQALYYNIAGLASDTLITKTTVFSTPAVVMAGYVGFHKCGDLSSIKMQFFMDGVQMAESAYLNDNSTAPTHITFVDNKVMSGSSIVRVDAHNYNAGIREMYVYARQAGATYQDGGIIIGAVK